MSQEVAKKEQIEVSLAATLSDMGIDISNIVIPKLLLQQGTSKLVNDGKAHNGDVIDSLTGEKVADKATQLEIAPIWSFKTWTTLEKGTGKFVKSEPFMGKKPYEEKLPDGRFVQNYETLNVYVLRVKEVKEEGFSFPSLISFRSTGALAGNKLATMMLRTSLDKKKYWTKSYMLGCLAAKNEKGNFHVFDIQKGTNTGPEIDELAKSWESTLKGGRAKVHETEQADDVEEDTSNAKY